MGLAKEFPIEKMDGFRIGNAQNEEAGTGVTVVLFDKDKGARAGVDVVIFMQFICFFHNSLFIFTCIYIYNIIFLQQINI